jgi:hypothetical protein
MPFGTTLVLINLALRYRMRTLIGLPIRMRALTMQPPHMAAGTMFHGSQGTVLLPG